MLVVHIKHHTERLFTLQLKVKHVPPYVHLYNISFLSL
jgi:hypothetical protein